MLIPALAVMTSRRFRPSVGSPVPLVGTVCGALVGGIVGGVGGDKIGSFVGGLFG